MDASNCKLSSSHPCGVYPLGNSLIDPQARSKRAARLGSFSRFDDELILSLVCAVPPVANCRLACTSSVFRAFCGQEELWREFCLQLLASTGRIEWSAHGSWKSTFVKSSAFHGASKATLHAVQVYSDILYRQHGWDVVLWQSCQFHVQFLITVLLFVLLILVFSCSDSPSTVFSSVS